MNKVLHINISGQVIAIEAPAYEALQAYLASLRQHFAAEEGCEEIINDIEGRIAEILGDKIRGGAAAVTTDDVNEVAAAMGSPADFARDAGEVAEGINSGSDQGSRNSGGNAAHATANTERPHKRLYRDSKDHILGGVCSGVANYLNVDTTLVRILFALVTFGGFGLGVFIYIALWILLPEKELEDTVTSRLFRNPDDKVIGGVASGIAAYLGKDPMWLRIILVAPFAINALLALVAWVIFLFGGDGTPALISTSLISTFVFAYVVMWVVLPEAGTPYERMRMRGEPVDINAIKQRVQSGLAIARQRIEAAGADLRRRSQQWEAQGRAWHAAGGGSARSTGSVGGASGTDGVEDAEYATVPPAAAAGNARYPVKATSGLGHATRVIAQVIMLSFACLMAFALFATLFAVAVGVAAWWWPARNYLWSSTWQEILVWATIVLFFFVPAIGLVIWLFRRGIGAPKRAALGWTYGCLWGLGWISAILLAANVSRDVSSYENVVYKVSPSGADASDQLTVLASQPEPTFSGWWAADEMEGIDISDQRLTLSLIDVKLKKSSDAAFHVNVKKYSAGHSEADARDRAERTQYQVAWQAGQLDLGSSFVITPAEKFRGQRIDVVIEVPAGKAIRFESSVLRKLSIRYEGDTPTERLRNAPWRDKFDWDAYDVELTPNTYYVMDENGALQMAPSSWGPTAKQSL